MTIKRRLFISNNMMLVVPILLSLIIISVMMYVVINTLGIQDNVVNNNRFYRSVVQVRSFTKEWPQHNDINRIRTDMDAFVENHSSQSIFLAIYRNGEQQYSAGELADNLFLEFALSNDEKHYFAMDKTGIYKMNAGEYTLLLADTNFQNISRLDNTEYYQYFANIMIFLIIIVIAIILLTNRLLTRMVIKRIIIPLDALTYGVHQIQDGNLSYRIMYEGKDEFAAVCHDFNEMAQRLMNMVNTIQKNDENRRELIAGISHDLRTPLTSIKAYVEGLAKGVASTPQIQKRYLNIIKSKTDDLEHIVSQLFLFSKLDIGEFPFQSETLDIGKDLSKFIKAASDEYNQKGLQINLLENVRGVLVTVDKMQLRNVFTNILENSLKYGKQDQAVMRVSCQSDHHHVTITLADNGSGIPEDALEKLFTIFYRSDKARSNTSQGSGLGLAISAKIMERLGGSIKAENVPECGLSISLTLPIIKEVDANEKNTDY